MEKTCNAKELAKKQEMIDKGTCQSHHLTEEPEEAGPMEATLAHHYAKHVQQLLDRFPHC